MGEHGYENGNHGFLLSYVEWGSSGGVSAYTWYSPRRYNIAILVFVSTRGPFVLLKIAMCIIKPPGIKGCSYCSGSEPSSFRR
jgi:hypothetical protein